MVNYPCICKKGEGKGNFWKFSIDRVDTDKLSIFLFIKRVRGREIFDRVEVIIFIYIYEYV